MCFEKPFASMCIIAANLYCPCIQTDIQRRCHCCLGLVELHGLKTGDEKGSALQFAVTTA